MEFMLQLLLTLAVLYLLARLGSLLFSRFGLPGLIGEILIGVIVANLGMFGFDLMGMLDIIIPAPGAEVTTGSPTYMGIYILAELGVIFLLFSVGLETKVSDLLGSGKAAFLTALLGVIFPFVAGFAVIIGLEGDTNSALFMGAAMVATSVGITARIIKDMKLMDSREARIIIGAAVIDDVLGMLVLAIVKGMASSGELSIVDILSITLTAVAFVVGIMLVAKFVVPKIYDYFERRSKEKQSKGLIPNRFNMLAMSLIVCLALAALAESIGLAAIIGSFFAGMLFAEHAWEWDLEKRVEAITTLPISFFFVNVGLQVDLTAFGDFMVLAIAVLIIVLALITKYFGCGLGAKLGDKSIDRQSFSIIGTGMMPRGEVGIITASIGLSCGVLSSDLYAVVVFMSVLTTIIAPPILSKLFRKKYSEDYTIIDQDRL